MVTHYKDDFSTANPQDIKRYLDVDLKIKIEAILEPYDDESNSIKMHDIIIKLGLKSKDDRKIREAISDMRLVGFLIGSSTKGYWMLKTYEAVKKWADFDYKYIMSLSHTVKVVTTSAYAKFGKYYQPPLIW